LLSKLVSLDLSRNGYLNLRFDSQDLSYNKLTGPIDQIQKPNSLEYIDLSSNDIHGSIPNSFFDLLTDTFPYWLSSLPRLRVLILRSNRLHGPMPNSIASSNFSALQIIDLSHNELFGPLPAKFFHNLRAMKDVPKDRSSESFLYKNPNAQIMYAYDYHQTAVNITTKRMEIELVKTLIIFTSLDFSNNLFSGQIPKELGELISLQALNLSNNNLTGPIPPSFGNTIALESLDLSSNKLGGRIPSQLTNLTFLAVSNLSQNALVGPIPHGKQFDTFENDSYSRNLRLCGLPLSKQCGNDEEPKLPVPMPKEDEGFEIAFIWKVVMMGYGCGVVLGLSMGYIVFTTGRPWWLSEWLRQIGKTMLLSGFAETEEDETSTTSTSCIDLSYNKLTGPIDQIQKPNSLEYIDLSSNDIHGSIPNSFFD
ncbi:Leucine-rich repeat - like 10, partial [Theobroma cacao]